MIDKSQGSQMGQNDQKVHETTLQNQHFWVRTEGRIGGTSQFFG